MCVFYIIVKILWRIFMKKKIILALLVICIVATAMIGLVACKKTTTKIIMTNLDVYMENDFYIGTQTKGSNTFDFVTAFEGATNFAYDSDELTLSGSKATINAAGEGKLTFTQNGATVEKNLFVVDGENVYTEDELRTALNVDKKNVVIQADIATEKKESFMTYGKVYGNGHVIDSTKTSVKGGADVFVAEGPDMSAWIQDLRIIGVKKNEGDEVILEDFAARGALISIVSDKVGESGDYLPSYIKNCILENGHKLISLYGANVTIEGCILRNSSDALIASGTDHRKGSTVTLKNNVLSTSIVCGFLFYGYNGDGGGNKNKPECQQTLNIEGFLDIYNWKSTDGITLMPPNEALADLVNSNVQKQITDSKFAAYLKTGSDGNKYVHAGIIILATNKSVVQTPTINGAEAVGFTTKAFPIPSWAKLFAHTCELLSYDEKQEISSYAVQPTDKVENNIEMFKELRYGRKA